MDFTLTSEPVALQGAVRGVAHAHRATDAPKRARDRDCPSDVAEMLAGLHGAKS